MPLTSPRLRPFLFPVLAAIMVVTWSSGFICTRLATGSAPAFLVLFWRTLVSGVVLLPLALIMGPRMTRAAIVQQMVFGTVGFFIYLSSFALAIAWGVPTGLVALISDLVPLAIAALSQPVLGVALTARQWLGMVVGVVGVVIVSADSVSLGHAPLLGYALPVAGMILFALMTVMQKRLGAVFMPSHQSLAIQCLTAAALFGAVQAPQGGLMPPHDLNFALGVEGLVISATFICYPIYYLCLRLYPAAQVASAVYLSPPVTMLFGWALFDELLSPKMFLGLAVTFVGVYLATFGTRAGDGVAV